MIYNPAYNYKFQLKTTLDETAFDMKIRKAGPIDFTLPSEDVESMIMALTRRDLGIWQQKQDKDENINQKDEL